jgi:mono/diheme cytochrome c family protein
LSEALRLLAAVGAALAALVALVPDVADAQAPAGDAQFAEGRAHFLGGATPPCAICHTLKEAGATGNVGPVLDDVQPDEARVAAAVRGGIGVMPSFAGSLSDAQIRALARYVSKATGGAR